MKTRHVRIVAKLATENGNVPRSRTTPPTSSAESVAMLATWRGIVPIGSVALVGATTDQGSALLVASAPGLPVVPRSSIRSMR